MQIDLNLGNARLSSRRSLADADPAASEQGAGPTKASQLLWLHPAAHPPLPWHRDGNRHLPLPKKHQQSPGHTSKRCLPRSGPILPCSWHRVPAAPGPHGHSGCWVTRCTHIWSCAPRWLGCPQCFCSLSKLQAKGEKRATASWGNRLLPLLDTGGIALV